MHPRLQENGAQGTGAHPVLFAVGGGLAACAYPRRAWPFRGLPSPLAGSSAAGPVHAGAHRAHVVSPRGAVFTFSVPPRTQAAGRGWCAEPETFRREIRL
eukprot:7385743-Prymnesium_polylepis.1